MVTEAKTTNYWISNSALYIQLNATGEPNRIQASVVSGASILCYMQGIDGLGYDAGHNYQRWTLAAYPSEFPSDEKRYVYVAIPRKRTSDNDIATIVFPSQKIDIYGKAIVLKTDEDGKQEEVVGDQIGSEDYYYIYLQGIISEVYLNEANDRIRRCVQDVDFGSLSTDEALASGGVAQWWKYNSVSDTITFLKTIFSATFESLVAKTISVTTLFFGKEKKITGIASDESKEDSEEVIVTPKYGNRNYLSKTKDDTAEGLITFAKGLITDAIKSLDYDNAAEQGFSVEKEKNGKYHAFFTNLTIWGKAIFHELEVRKLSYSGGNIYLSGAGSKLIKVVPVKKSVSNGLTSWVETTEDDTECVGWKCYLLADNGTTATMNYWQEGDQARCQTMGEIVAGGAYSDVSNKSYWRTIPDGGISTQNEKIYGTMTETYLDEAGKEQTKKVQVELYGGQSFAWIVVGKHCGDIDGYDDEFSVGYNGSNPAPLETRDIPAEGDTIVLDGNRHRNEHGEYDKTDRQNVIILETTGEYAPRIACYANITEYKHTITKSVNGSDKEVSLSVFETSPKAGTKINSSRFEWISDDGSTINIINYRGDWVKGTKYHKNDQVNHNNAVWVCVANSGVSVEEDEPSEGSSYWKKVLSGGKGEKGDDAVSYSVSLMKELRTIAGYSNQSAVTVSFRKQEGSKSTVSGNIATFGDSASVKCYVDGERSDNMTDWINSGNDYFGYLNYEDAWAGKSVITVVMYIGDNIVASANFSLGQSGEGVVMAYKNAPSRPEPPTTKDPSALSDGWSRTPQKGGSYIKVDNISYGSFDNGASLSVDSTSKSWTDVTEDGNSWKKSPSGLSDRFGWAIMKVSFSTHVDNLDIKVIIKAYSEANFDFIQVHALDTEITGSSDLLKKGVVYTSGNGVEDSYSYHVATAGQHFFYVSYCKDTNGNSNGDYGLFRFDLSDNLVSMPSTVWMSQAILKEGKAVLPWSTPVQITGADAYRVVVSPSVLIFDTDDNGRVAKSFLSGKTATIRVYQGDKDVSKQFSKYDRYPSNYYNCNGSLKDLNTSPLEIQVTEIETQVVTDTAGNKSTISKTNGFLEFILTNDSATVTAHVDVQVNVAKFTGQMVNTNKRFSNTLQEVSTSVDDKVDKSDLNEFKAEITQTAREISLSVSEKSVGRRNLLAGSAFNRQEGFGLLLDSNIRGYGILMNDGVDGMNCIRVASYYDTNRYQYCGAFWGGYNTKNIRIKHGTRYTFSCWVKVDEADTTVYLEVIYNRAEIGQDRDGRPTGAYSFYIKEPNKWQLVKWSFTTDDTHEWIEANVFTSSDVAYRTFVARFCKPMLEEGDYNGWTLSQEDYDYVGGNMLDNTLSLDKSGSLYDVNGTLIPAGFGENTFIYKSFTYKLKGTVDSLSQLPTSGNVYDDTYYVRNNGTCYAYNGSEFVNVGDDYYFNILHWGKQKSGAFIPFGLEANKDYVFSFMAKGTGLLTAYFYNPDTNVFIEDSLGGTGNAVNGQANFQLTNKWERYWVHWRPSDSLHKYVLLRLNRSIQSNNGDAPITDCYIAQPKLEEGARVTEYTERKSDLVDKASLKAAGIEITSDQVTLYGNQIHVKKNKTDANDTVLIDNETGQVSAGLINANKVVADGIKTQDLEAQNLNVTGNSRLGIFRIKTSGADERDQYTIAGDMITYSGDYKFPDGTTTITSNDGLAYLMYKPLFIRQGAPDAGKYMRLGNCYTEWDDSGFGFDHSYLFNGASARYVCGGVESECKKYVLPTDLTYNTNYFPVSYIYSIKSSPNDPAFAINVQKAKNTTGERTAIQTNGAIRGVLAPNSMSISWDGQTIPNGIGVVICTNGSEMTLTLPANPLEGQTLIIIQGSDKRVYIVPSGDEVIYCGGQTRDKNNKFFSGMIGQFNIFVFIRGNWQLQWMNYRL